MAIIVAQTTGQGSIDPVEELLSLNPESDLGETANHQSKYGTVF